MQIRSKILALPLVSLALAACASTQETTTYIEPQRVPGAVTIQPDMEYVSRIEQMARNQGVVVRWVNAPDKRVASND